MFRIDEARYSQVTRSFIIHFFMRLGPTPDLQLIGAKVNPK